MELHITTARQFVDVLLGVYGYGDIHGDALMVYLDNDIDMNELGSPYNYAHERDSERHLWNLTIDGQGFKIKNFYFCDFGSSFFLLAAADNGGYDSWLVKIVFKNITFFDIYIQCSDSQGFAVYYGTTYSGTTIIFENVKVYGAFEALNGGQIINGSDINNCFICCTMVSNTMFSIYAVYGNGEKGMLANSGAVIRGMYNGSIRCFHPFNFGYYGYKTNYGLVGKVYRCFAIINNAFAVDYWSNYGTGGGYGKHTSIFNCYVCAKKCSSFNVSVYDSSYFGNCVYDKDLLDAIGVEPTGGELGRLPPILKTPNIWRIIMDLLYKKEGREMYERVTYNNC